jgi:hypothetical protein
MCVAFKARYNLLRMMIVLLLPSLAVVAHSHHTVTAAPRAAAANAHTYTYTHYATDRRLDNIHTSSCVFDKLTVKSCLEPEGKLHRPQPSSDQAIASNPSPLYSSSSVLTPESQTQTQSYYSATAELPFDARLERRMLRCNKQAVIAGGPLLLERRIGGPLTHTFVVLDSPACCLFLLTHYLAACFFLPERACARNSLCAVEALD